ncbi:MAG: VWA domain-containing protein [Deltaproteobacteria bacterium]|jgi:uncharacterized protein YegL|nr:VWA domain-containing protein [Deltaproteobacteria bacterium]
MDARKLPIYILIDTSGSMRGTPIEAVKAGLKALLDSLRKDAHAIGNAHLSIISFDRSAKVLMPMTPVASAWLPEIPELESSPTNLGEALELMCSRYSVEVRRHGADGEGDRLPVALVMTDGAPSDTLLFSGMCRAVKGYPFARIIGCAAGPKAKQEPLRRFCTDVVTLEAMDSGSFSKFWEWASLAFAGQGRGGDIVTEGLPPPPPEIKLIF